jgi:hypothetical protein
MQMYESLQLPTFNLLVMFLIYAPEEAAAGFPGDAGTL